VSLAHVLLLAQEELGAPTPGFPPQEVLLYFVSFFASVVFVATGYQLFSVGWQSYEEKYVEGAARTIDDLFLTIPPQQLIWLSLLAAWWREPRRSCSSRTG